MKPYQQERSTRTCQTKGAQHITKNARRKAGRESRFLLRAKSFIYPRGRAEVVFVTLFDFLLLTQLSHPICIVLHCCFCFIFAVVLLDSCSFVYLRYWALIVFGRAGLLCDTTLRNSDIATTPWDIDWTSLQESSTKTRI